MVSFEQLVEAYRYRSAGHPVAIKIEEQDTSRDKTDLELAEELLKDPEFALEAEGESFADRQVREHQESQRAVRAGTRKATLESHKLLKRAKVTGRYKTTSDTEESESESLANIATRSANTNLYTASLPVPVIPDPEPEFLGPNLFEESSEEEEEEVQLKVEDFDC